MGNYPVQYNDLPALNQHINSTNQSLFSSNLSIRNGNADKSNENENDAKIEKSNDDMKLDLSLPNVNSSGFPLNHLSQINQLNTLNEEMFKVPFNNSSIPIRQSTLHNQQSQLCNNLGT